ncbi:hypothetical protein B0F90DRAFT_1712295 [Multifurca ochricompacta]|uniref:Protein kinase domain-containing protein n=1 Tax=Multifurca ochricompacta TaxID=376703 RepID=A0AAD4M6W7_9AGAM|nr:hypothetical protein B0F90DRAFT_1712295 [Multifurca ochricompacta]
MAIAGPWMCIAGGIYLEKAIVQPLTDYIWLGSDAFKEQRFHSTLRLFAALKSAISSLRDYYESLDPSNVIPRDLQYSFPFIKNYGSQSFKYLAPLADYRTGKLVYKAVLHGSDQLIVVKFVSTYNAEAHRLLATHQLAPILHFAGTEDIQRTQYGERFMVIMDFVDGSEPKEGPLSIEQYGQVNQAVQLLHQQNFVFGDLRTSNLLISSGEKKMMMLIDFDWCGKADESVYPSTLNTDSGIQWPDEVWPGEVMKKEHDVTMLERLRPVVPHAGVI